MIAVTMGLLELLIPTVLLTGGVYALTKTTESSEPTQAPVFPPEVKAAFIDTATVDGIAVQTFKPEMASAILQELAKRGLAELSVEDNAPGRVMFKVVGPAGDLSATQAAIQAQSKGLIVLGSLSLSLAKTTADQHLIFAPPEDRTKLAGKDFAILLDVAAAAATSERPAASQVTPSPRPRLELDAHIPIEVAREVAEAFGDEQPSVAGLRAMAETLERTQFPRAAEALRTRASGVELQRTLAAQRRVPELPAPSASVEPAVEVVLQAGKTASPAAELEAGKTASPATAPELVDAAGKTTELEAAGELAVATPIEPPANETTGNVVPMRALDVPTVEAKAELVEGEKPTPRSLRRRTAL